MLLIGLKNTAVQSVLNNGIISLGSVYRKNCRKDTCGIKTFDVTNDNVVLQQSGMYKITATITFTAPTAGNVIFQLTENGEAISGATATERITTASTEVKTTTIDYLILVDKGCVLGVSQTIFKTIGLLNSGVGATISNVVFNVVKEA